MPFIIDPEVCLGYIREHIGIFSTRESLCVSVPDELGIVKAALVCGLRIG